MYFAYIDESGTSDINDPNSLEFILTAVIIHEKDWVKFQEACRDLREDIWLMLKNRKFNEVPNDFEIHIKDICNRKRYFNCLIDNDDLWLKVMEEIFERIKWMNIKIISSIIVKDKFIEEEFEDVYKWAFTLLIERLQWFLEFNKPELDENILIVLDSIDPESDAQQRKHMEEFRISGTGHGWDEYPINVIESPFIVDSHIHLGVQIADGVAYVLRRYVFKILERNPEAFFNQYCNKFLEKIGHLFHRSDKNVVKGYGVKIFPHKFRLHKSFWEIFHRNDDKMPGTLDKFLKNK